MKKLLFICVLLSVNLCYSQSDTLARKYVKVKKITVASLITVQHLGSFYAFNNWWWKNQQRPFHFNNDKFFNNYTLGMDKLGHAFTSYMYFHGISEVMRWAEFSDKSRFITSTTLPLIWAVAIEIGDAHSDYGYSWHDLAANFTGLGLAVLQEKVPYARNFKFKMSYYPTQYFIDNNFSGWNIETDYRGHFYWLAFDVHNMLPKVKQRYWPKFLNLAVGYGIDRNANRFNPPTKRDFGIALDWNLSCFKTTKKTATLFKNLADNLHFPAPGLAKLTNEPARAILFR